MKFERDNQPEFVLCWYETDGGECDHMVYAESIIYKWGDKDTYEMIRENITDDCIGKSLGLLMEQCWDEVEGKYTDWSPAGDWLSKDEFMAMNFDEYHDWLKNQADTLDKEWCQSVQFEKLNHFSISLDLGSDVEDEIEFEWDEFKGEFDLDVSEVQSLIDSLKEDQDEDEPKFEGICFAVVWNSEEGWQPDTTFVTKDCLKDGAAAEIHAEIIEYATKIIDNERIWKED